MYHKQMDQFIIKNKFYEYKYITNMNFHELLGRVYGLAVIDIVGTIVIALFIAKRYNFNKTKTLIFAFILGEVVHVVLDIDTPITKMLGF